MGGEIREEGVGYGLLGERGWKRNVRVTRAQLAAGSRRGWVFHRWEAVVEDRMMLETRKAEADAQRVMGLVYRSAPRCGARLHLFFFIHC